MNINDYRDLVHENTKAFDTKKALNAIYSWLDDYLSVSNTKKVVIGISGGKDSTVVAAILANKLGKENVFGLLMPNGEQKDISDSLRVVSEIGIWYDIVNIKPAYDAMISMLNNDVSAEAKINIAPRIRMTTLYTWGQTHGCRVAGTGNLSEITLGYFTKFGDGAHDFNIIANFTSLEVIRLGEELGLPLDLVYKTPDDGLSGMSDEEKLGLSYIDMHTYLRKDRYKLSNETLDKIMVMERKGMHKRETEPSIDYSYCQVEIPEVGKEVEITDKNGRKLMAFLTITSFYPEGLVFETVHTGNDIRLGDVIDWKYT